MLLTILDLNAGLLEWFGRAIVPAPYVAERLAALPGAIRQTGADAVLLQEIYRERHRRFVAEALHDLYPFVAYVRAGRRWGLENGLMSLSRRPLESRLELFRHAPFDERLVDHKGILITRSEWGVTLLNIHTTAGGVLSLPEKPGVESIRARQIRQIVAAADSASNTVPIIAGDLNAGPGVSEGNYRLFADAGYVAAHTLLHGEEGDYTWEPGNALNALGPHRASPPQRIDHLFVRTADIAAGRITPRRSEIVFRAPMVNVGNRAPVTLSDHYGVLTVFDVNS